ncbi:IclR family transcriptional regulator domain-containing protein [Thorsellia anophelis]|uniref:HTH-type transcriptional repressor AllR n=1 Tax=Thorsellia anophelis DSM 18579 TaxID=1123402 RepID=A0A1I0CMC3_9GAMM|nr:IclR family transcriptional regulator C-terminal domain-containing protein [Thorsellia anophelis]SET20375.1 transcriptional regulator, IclR family [Thorsellia anophelis DSM 18579]
MNSSNKTQASKANVSQVQSLSRGLQLIEAIASSRDGLTLTELAVRVNLPNSTTHRLLKTVESHGFIFHDLSNERWQVSGKLFSMGSTFARSRDLMQIATPVMKQLMNESGETVNMCVLDTVKLDAVIVGQVQCLELMRMVSPIGARLPIHASGGGKVLLSNYSNLEIEHLFKNDKLFTQYTEHTLGTLANLLDALALVRDKGYAYDNEEHALDLRCIAAPISDEHNQIFAAVSVSGPKARMTDEKINKIIIHVKNAAQEISRRYTMI